MDQEYIKGLSLVKSSGYRLKILKALENEIKMPSEIAKETDLRLNHVSMFLTEMMEHKLVQCLNQDERKGRLYQITKNGKNVLRTVNPE